jgi:hypothetical protein
VLTFCQHTAGVARRGRHLRSGLLLWPTGPDRVADDLVLRTTSALTSRPVTLSLSRRTRYTLPVTCGAIDHGHPLVTGELLRAW